MYNLIKPYVNTLGSDYILPYLYKNNSNGKGIVNNTVKVEGVGIVTVKPNQAVISLGIVTEGMNVAKVQQDNSIILNKVITELKNMGVKEENIETTIYRITPVYDYPNNKKTLRGYEVRHIFEIIVKDITKVGSIIDNAIKSGANVVNNIKFTVDEQDGYYHQALEKATINARKKAEAIGRSIGVEINKVPITVIEKDTEIEQRIFEMPRVEATDAVTVPIQEGKIEIMAIINAVFEYKS